MNEREDPIACGKTLRGLWPDPAIREACFLAFQDSIRIAHSAGDACWSITLFDSMVRLNVGQVETLTIDGVSARFLFEGRLNASAAPLGSEIRPGEIIGPGNATRAVYRAVPIESGFCVVPIGKLPRVSFDLKDAHFAYIRRAAALKGRSPFWRSFSLGVLACIEYATGDALPRPSHPNPNGFEDMTAHPDVAAMEGAAYETTLTKHERDPRNRKACVSYYGTDCYVCGFSFAATFGPTMAGFIHVHHLNPLAEIGEEHSVDPVRDLRPVCPNCHAALHRRRPPYSIEKLQSLLEESRTSLRDEA